MKAMFFIMCVVATALAGFLAFTLQSGRLVMNPYLEEIGPSAAQRHEPIIGSQVGLVNELVSSLQAAQADLDSRSKELDRREADLLARIATFEKIRRETELLMGNLDDRMVQVNQNDLRSSKQLAGVYAKMDPAAAAQAFRNMDHERVAMVLSQMDGRSMATVLNAAVTTMADGSQYVADWSEALRRLTDEQEAQ